MGAHQTVTERMSNRMRQQGEDILVIASAACVEALRHDDVSQFMPGLKVVAREPGEAIGDDLLARARLVVVEVEPGNGQSAARLTALRERFPQVPVVAAIEGASVSIVRTLVRQGIADVVSLPFDVPELLQACVDTLAVHEVKRDKELKLGSVIAVTRSIGGCGATSIATHLAADLAAHDTTGRGALIVDMDLQFGSVADFLGVRTRGSLADLLEARDRLDEDLLKSMIGQTSSGLHVIAAPDAIMPLESVDTDYLLNLIRMLRQQFAYVVLDLPANWTNWTLSAALGADTVLLVVELSVASLRQAKRRLELFRSVGIDEKAVQIVVNRVEKRLFRTIALDDVSETLGHPVLGSIALEAPAVSVAQNQGMLTSEVHRKSKFASDTGKIGAMLRNGVLAREQ
jgi:pilus assembly protein CpaE